MTERRLPGGYNTADQNDIIQKGANGIWFTRGPGEMVLPGRHLLRTIYTTGTAATHNLQTRTTKFRVYGQGPGGGGGGADGQSAPSIGMGVPGSSGAYFDHLFTVSVGVTSFTYTVGQGGAAGSGNTAGSDGTANTQVTYNGVTVGGGPGLGGASEDAVNRSSPTFCPNSPPAGGAVIGSPNIGVSGQRGGLGFNLDIFNGASGKGGDSVLGRGGDSVFALTGGAAQLNGNPGFLGGGGSGGFVCNLTPSVDGGAGGTGILIVEEYS